MDQTLVVPVRQVVRVTLAEVERVAEGQEPLDPVEDPFGHARDVAAFGRALALATGGGTVLLAVDPGRRVAACHTLLAISSGLEVWRLRSGSGPAKDWVALVEALGPLAASRIFFVGHERDRDPVSLDDVIGAPSRGQRPVDLVLVDASASSDPAVARLARGLRAPLVQVGATLPDSLRREFRSWTLVAIGKTGVRAAVAARA